MIEKKRPKKKKQKAEVTKKIDPDTIAIIDGWKVKTTTDDGKPIVHIHDAANCYSHVALAVNAMDGLAEAVKEFKRTEFQYPATYEGRGIVFSIKQPCEYQYVFTAISLLREYGCELPVQVWYVGEHVMPECSLWRFDGLNVEIVEALDIEKYHPSRILGPKELFPYSIIHCPFKEVLALNVNNVPTRNVEALFELPSYKAKGALFWRDVFHSTLPSEEKFKPLLDACGVERKSIDVMTDAQVLIDKETCWRELQLMMLLSEHSDIVGHHTKGTRDIFQVAWKTVGTKPAMASTPPEEIPRFHPMEGREARKTPTQGTTFFGPGSSVSYFNYYWKRSIDFSKWGKKRDWNPDIENKICGYLDELAERPEEIARKENKKKPEIPLLKSNRMMAVTVAVGDEFVEMAEYAAESVRKYTGLPTLVITDDLLLQHPMISQFSSPEERSALAQICFFDFVDGNILYFDADLMIKKSWDVRQYMNRQEVIAVRDQCNTIVTSDTAQFNLDFNKYFNMGMMIVNSMNHGYLFEETIKRHWSQDGGDEKAITRTFNYQTLFNKVCQEYEAPLLLLPEKYNYTSYGAQGRGRPDDVVVAHAAGGQRKNFKEQMGL